CELQCVPGGALRSCAAATAGNQLRPSGPRSDEPHSPLLGARQQPRTSFEVATACSGAAQAPSRDSCGRTGRGARRGVAGTERYTLLAGSTPGGRARELTTSGKLCRYALSPGLGELDRTLGCGAGLGKLASPRESGGGRSRLFSDGATRSADHESSGHRSWHGLRGAAARESPSIVSWRVRP